jgi:hypothetical protein
MSSNLRETLLRCDAIAQLPEIREYKIVKEMRNLIKGALAEPLRNCDVGTAEEQGERFILFCRRNSFRGVCNDSCKFANVNRRLVWQKIGQARCFPFWSQMPYEKEGKE